MSQRSAVEEIKILEDFMKDSKLERARTEKTGRIQRKIDRTEGEFRLGDSAYLAYFPIARPM